MRRMPSGMSRQTTVMPSDARNTSCMLMRMTLRMRPMSPLPQYCAMSTLPPDERPKPNDIKMENGCPPRFAAAMATSPKLPSITLSITATPKLIIFCSAMGTAMASSVPTKARLSKKCLSSLCFTRFSFSFPCFPSCLPRRVSSAEQNRPHTPSSKAHEK